MSAPRTSKDTPAPNLRPITRFVTTHREDGKAVVHATKTPDWQVLSDGMAFNLIYTTSEFPPQMTDEKDIRAHEELSRAGTGLVNKGGSVCRVVDFGPGTEPVMHRTKSLDYGVVLEGDVEMILDSGEAVTLRRGDVAVQRGTMHAWRNNSSTEWARMLFVLQDSRPVEVAGEELKETFVTEVPEIPPSNNSD